MRKNLFLLTLFAILAFYTTSCGGKADKPQDAEDEATEETTTADEDEGLEEVEAYDATKGEGKFDESNVKVGALDKAMAAKEKLLQQVNVYLVTKLLQSVLLDQVGKVLLKEENHIGL